MEAGVLRYFEVMKMLLKFAVLILLLGVLIHLSCKKEYSCEGCRDGNKPPVANAGPDQVITLPTDSVSLDGSSFQRPGWDNKQVFSGQKFQALLLLISKMHHQQQLL